MVQGDLLQHKIICYNMMLFLCTDRKGLQETVPAQRQPTWRDGVQFGTAIEVGRLSRLVD